MGKIFFKTNIIKFKWNWWEKTMQLFISITNFISSCSVKMMIMDWRNSFIHILWNVKCKNIFENDMFKLKVDIQSTLLILFCWNFQVFLHTLILTPTINNKTDSKIREIREIKWNERRKTKTKQRPRWVLEWNGSTLWQQIKLTHIHTYIHTYTHIQDGMFGLIHAKDIFSLVLASHQELLWWWKIIQSIDSIVKLSGWQYACQTFCLQWASISLE